MSRRESSAVSIGVASKSDIRSFTFIWNEMIAKSSLTIYEKRNSSGSGEDGKVEADRTCFYFRRHELSSDAPKTIRDVPVNRLSSTYFLTRPPPPLSPHSDF